MARKKAREDEPEASLLDRRTFIRAAGAAVASAAAVGSASGEASAATAGYGAGGYGAGAYGGAVTAPVRVATGAARNVTDSAATLVGEVTDLGSAASADVAFEYRPSGSNAWTRTYVDTVSATGRFSAAVSDLHGDTDYVFRAVARAGGVDHYGTDRSFTTAPTEHAPSIGTFSVTKSEQLGSERMITVRWSVSDADGDLDTVEIVTAEDLSSLNFAVTDVDGANASGWELFQFPVGASVDVTLRATDGAGNVTDRTKTVSL